MKKLLLFGLSILTAITFASCKKDDPTVTAISFAEKSTSLVLGKSVQLQVNHTPNDLAAPVYHWTSSDPSIATIIDGTITAIRLGETIISVSTTSGLSASCTLKVTPVEAEKITLNKQTSSLVVGKTETLIYTVLPENTTYKTVSWKSSDTSIASVDNYGNVKAVAAGTAIITAQTRNGHTAQCTYSIETIPVTGITLDKASLQIDMTDTYELIPKLTPADATNQRIMWTSKDKNIATVSDNGVVTAVSPGKTTITATTEDGNFTSTCAIEVAIKLALSAQELNMLTEETSNLSVYLAGTNTPYVNATWKSSDPNIATVTSNGNNSATITAKARGTVTISASTADGKKTTSCTVTIKDISDYITLKFIPTSVVIINGNVSGSLYSEITNNSKHAITLTRFTITDSDTGFIVGLSTNPSQLGVLEPGKNITLGKNHTSFVYKPIYSWEFTYDGKTYTVAHQYGTY